jgi:hypothetical protein
MIWISTTPDAAACPPAGAISPWLVDEFLESYVCWREAADEATEAYARWTDADGEHTAVSFAAYRAALDGEEAAARGYGDCVERIAGRPR